jgi:polyisoprenoid-binding protein YceI
LIFIQYIWNKNQNRVLLLVLPSIGTYIEANNMKNSTMFLKVILATVLLSISTLSSHAAGHGAKWELVKSESSISFVSVKKGSIGEAHIFTDFSGIIDHNQATVSIKPDSVDTRIPIRNERAREFLFKTGIYPTIKISSDVASAMAALKKGETGIVELPASLSMLGVTKEVSLSVSVIRNGKKSISVASIKPIIIKASDFKMEAGVAKLGELAGGISIATAVPVSFILTVTKQDKTY